MTVALRSLDVAGLVPKLTVLDEDHNPLASEIVVNGGGELVLQVTGIDPHADFSIGIEAANPGGPFDSGNYRLMVAFTETSVTLESMAAGTVSGAATGNVHTLYIGRPQLFHLVLEAEQSATSAPSAIIATIKDEDSTVVATIAAPPGERRSLPGVFLNAGTYTVEVVLRTLDRSLSSVVNYSLLGTSISDPFVGDPADPNSHPFACMDPELSGFFCYPGDIISPDPFLWDNFVESLPAPPPPLDLGPLVNLLLGDWWSWVWTESGVNGPPLAQDDGFETTPSGAGSGSATTTIPLGPASNVLANDFEPEGDPFVALLKTSTTHGSLLLNPDGTFAYTPDPGFTGTDRFTYSAYDFRQESAVATVRVVVSSGVVGDYNSDGIVDNNDYLAWKTNFGSVDDLLADGNHNGQVDLADYTVWRNRLANFAAGAGAVDIAVGTPLLSVESTFQSSAAGASEIVTPIDIAPPSPLRASADSASPILSESPPRLSARLARIGTTVHQIDGPSLLLAVTNHIRRGDHLSLEAVPSSQRNHSVDAALETWTHQRHWLRTLDVEALAGASNWPS